MTYHLQLETRELAVALEIDSPISLAELEAKISEATKSVPASEKDREKAAIGVTP